VFYKILNDKANKESKTKHNNWWHYCAVECNFDDLLHQN